MKTKKLLTQKLNQLLDVVVCRKQRKEISKDLLELKLTKEDEFYLTLLNKYKNYEN
jgi:hypothetical protein